MSAPASLIEVERKFEASLGSGELEAAVLKSGGRALGQKRF